MKHTEKVEVVNLRLSIARMAQMLRVETDQLPVRGRDYNELVLMAEFRERGWNTLCGRILDAIEARTDLQH